MFTTHYRIRPGEARSLVISQRGGISIKEIHIIWKNNELGRFTSRKSARQGQVFTLENGEQLSLSHSGRKGTACRILLNGQPIADKGLIDGFNFGAENQAVLGWGLILAPFIFVAWPLLWFLLAILIMRIGNFGPELPEFVIRPEEILPLLQAVRFSFAPLGEISFLGWTLVVIILGGLMLVLSRLTQRKKLLAMVIGFLISTCLTVIGVNYFISVVREVGWDAMSEIGPLNAEWVTFFMPTILAVGTTLRNLADFYLIQRLRAGK